MFAAGTCSGASSTNTTASLRDRIGVSDPHGDPTLLPHHLRHETGLRDAEPIYVRHGSHVELPTLEELAALMAEGKRARTRERLHGSVD
jgi:hypothetical protein